MVFAVEKKDTVTHIEPGANGVDAEADIAVVNVSFDVEASSVLKRTISSDSVNSELEATGDSSAISGEMDDDSEEGSVEVIHDKISR